MRSALHELLRRLSYLPVLRPLAAWVEDELAFSRVAGSASRRADTAARLEACRSAADWLSFVRPILPPTQIEAEITGFLALAAERRVRRILEIGTAQGGTTLLLARAIPTTDWLVTVDLRPRHRRTLRFLAGDGRVVHSLGGSSRAPAVRHRIATLAAGEPLDLLFIDGDHSYEGARADYECYVPLVRPGGLIAWHDIVPAAETGAPTAGHRWVGGVPRLWQEVKNDGARCWEFVQDWQQQGFGIGVIEKK